MPSNIFNISPEVAEWTDFFYQTLNQFAFPTFLSQLDQSTKTIVEIEGEEIFVDSAHMKIPRKKLNKLIKFYIDPKNKLYFKDLKFEMDITLIPDELFSLDLYSGFYNEHIAEYRKGKLRNAGLYFDIYLPYSILEDYDGVMNDYNINSKLYEIISHEMDHAFEFLDRRDGGDTPIFQDRLVNFLIYLNKQNKTASLSPDWEKFLNLCYYNLSFERNARVTQLYYSLVDFGVKKRKDFMTLIQDSDAWKEISELRDFDAEYFYDNFSWSSTDEDLKEAFIHSGIYIEEDFLNNDIKTLVLRYFLNEWNKYIDMVNEEFIVYGDLVLRKLPQNFLDEPIQFLNHYEEVFTNNWFKFYGKVSKLSKSFKK